MTMHLAISLDEAGFHPAAWREADAEPDRLFDADRLVSLVQRAEQGLFDFVTLADSFGLRGGGGGVVRGQLDALLALARVAPATSSIGLVPTVTTTHTEPFHVSKNIATLDFVSHGRAGWMVDITPGEDEARHFGRRPSAPPAELYAEAGEAIEVVRQLWDSWEDDAVIRDVATGRYIDRDRLHYVDFEGRFFSVRGPSITPRSPQAQSLVVVEARDDDALWLAIAHADVIVIHAATAQAASELRARIRSESDAAVLAAATVLIDGTDAAAAATRARLDSLRPQPASGLDIVATAGGVADALSAWVDADAADGFLIRPALLPRTLDQLVDEVIPRLQQRGTFRTSYEAHTLRGLFGLDRPPNRYAPLTATREQV